MIGCSRRRNRRCQGQLTTLLLVLTLQSSQGVRTAPSSQGIIATTATIGNTWSVLLIIWIRWLEGQYGRFVVLVKCLVGSENAAIKAFCSYFGKSEVLLMQLAVEVRW